MPKHSPVISLLSLLPSTYEMWKLFISQRWRASLGCIGYNRSIYYHDLGIYYEYHHQHDIINRDGSLRYYPYWHWYRTSTTTHTAIGSSQDATNQAKCDSKLPVECHTTSPFNIALTDILSGRSGMSSTRQVQERPRVSDSLGCGGQRWKEEWTGVCDYQWRKDVQGSHVCLPFFHA